MRCPRASSLSVTMEQGTIRVSNCRISAETWSVQLSRALVDIEACTARGIQVSNTPGAVDNATATTGIYLALGAIRQYYRAEKTARQGNWNKGSAPARDPEGKVLGVIGMGGIGSVSGPECESSRKCRGSKQDRRLRVSDIIHLVKTLQPDLCPAS